MNKLDLFRFGNTRKKKIRLYVIITSCVLFLAAVILIAIGVFSYRSELVKGYRGGCGLRFFEDRT